MIWCLSIRNSQNNEKSFSTWLFYVLLSLSTQLLGQVLPSLEKEFVSLCDLSYCCPYIDLSLFGLLLFLLGALFPAHWFFALVQRLSEDLNHDFLILLFEPYLLEVKCIFFQGEYIISVCSAKVYAYLCSTSVALNRLQVHEEMNLLIYKIRLTQSNLLEWYMLLLEKQILLPSLLIRHPFTISIDVVKIYYYLLAFDAMHLTTILYFYIYPVH